MGDGLKLSDREKAARMTRPKTAASDGSEDGRVRPFCTYPHPSRHLRYEDVQHEMHATEMHAAGVIHCRTACYTCRARDIADGYIWIDATAAGTGKP